MIVDPKTQNTCRESERCSTDHLLSFSTRVTARWSGQPVVPGCAPVQSAGQLRGSSSHHGSGLQTSQGCCPWTLPPSPSPLASPPPSEAHIRMPSLVSARCVFTDEPLCYESSTPRQCLYGSDVFLDYLTNIPHMHFSFFSLFPEKALWWKYWDTWIKASIQQWKNTPLQIKKTAKYIYSI